MLRNCCVILIVLLSLTIYSCAHKQIQESCPRCEPCPPCPAIQSCSEKELEPKEDNQKSLTPPTTKTSNHKTQKPKEHKSKYVCKLDYTGSDTYYLSNGQVSDLFKQLIKYLESHNIKTGKEFYTKLILKYYESSESESNLKTIYGRDLVPKSIWDEMFAEKNAKGLIIDMLLNHKAAPIIKNINNIKKENDNYICFP